ncbi:MAG TPA: efflux RND transporter periplasmic adaptor subunit [Gemmatimonadaceae bacterium]|jgi:RND family efflux transporter MFP subunit|nr:efflux RND transporter periplasmic adaptor subunit [Gemmatimonadaceae bacterium]
MAAPTDRPDSSPVTGGLRWTAIIVIIAALGAAALLASRRSHAVTDETARRTGDAAGGPTVRAIAAVASAPSHRLELLAEARPYASVTLYAKVSGYLKWIGVDKGDRVKADQVVAIIESPETDASWSAATADYKQKQLTASRLKQLLDRKFASQEETDLAAADEAVARERLNSLTQQREFEKLKVPFNGTVTARFADPGALVQNAAASQTSALPVVTVENADSLRIYAYLDQSDAASVHVGLPAILTMDERAGVKINVRVARTSGELDAKTRKLLVEFDVDNRAGTIVPGSFVHIEMDVPAPVMPEIPSEALLVRQERSLVAVLAADSTVHFHDVTVASNDGKRLRVLKGIAIGDRVVLNAGDAITDGARVRPAADAAATPRKP